MRLTLSSGDLFLEIDPAAGGAVSARRLGDLDILRPAPPRSGPAYDPLEYAAFPMVPFVGRIHNGQCAINGSTIQLHPNLQPEPHAIHGYGWQSAWKVSSHEADTITLVHEHSADAWPWDYVATQTFRIEDTALIVELGLTNRGPNAMPAGLGWHPYFYRKGAALTAPTIQEWCPDEESGDNIPRLPTAEADLSSGRVVEELKLDTAFSVGAPKIDMAWPTHRVTLRSDPVFTHATVFVPNGKDFFCAEPITHAPNAVNSALPAEVTGLRWLEPGETLSGTIRLQIDR